MDKLILLQVSLFKGLLCVTFIHEINKNNNRYTVRRVRLSSSIYKSKLITWTPLTIKGEGQASLKDIVLSASHRVTQSMQGKTAGNSCKANYLCIYQTMVKKSLPATAGIRYVGKTIQSLATIQQLADSYMTKVCFLSGLTNTE